MCVTTCITYPSLEFGGAMNFCHLFCLKSFDMMFTQNCSEFLEFDHIAEFQKEMCKVNSPAQHAIR